MGPLFRFDPFLSGDPDRAAHVLDTPEQALHVRRQAMCQTFFDHWEHVPGDPLDRSILLLLGCMMSHRLDGYACGP